MGRDPYRGKLVGGVTGRNGDHRDVLAHDDLGIAHGRRIEQLYASAAILAAHKSHSQQRDVDIQVAHYAPEQGVAPRAEHLDGQVVVGAAQLLFAQEISHNAHYAAIGLAAENDDDYPRDGGTEQAPEFGEGYV